MRGINEIDNVYGKWTVKEFSHKSKKQGDYFWTCECECGTIKPVRASQLRNGRSTKCVNCQSKSRIKDEVGNVYGKWTVKEFSNLKKKSGATYWTCECECGNIYPVLGASLRNGNSTQCKSCYYGFDEANVSQREIGNVYGKLTVKKLGNKGKSHNLRWICECECGNIQSVSGQNLRSGSATQCSGCKNKGKNLYMIQCGPYVKIGVANNVNKRLIALQTGNPLEIKLVGLWKDEGHRESEWHKELEHCHVRGEWFKVGTGS